MEASPAKRRALAPLDANVQSPACNKTLKSGQAKSQVFRDAITATTTSTAPNATGSNKRSISMADDQAAKRQCIAAPSVTPVYPNTKTPPRQERDCSTSPEPEPSSIFDNSAIDNSQVTCTTEPDVPRAGDEDAHTSVGVGGGAGALVSLPSSQRLRRSTYTREETRQKAEILRLRLGLAGYKLRTGQENVPLERLQLRRPYGSKPDSRLSRPGHSSEQSTNRQAILQIGDQRLKLPGPRLVLSKDERAECPAGSVA